MILNRIIPLHELQVGRAATISYALLAPKSPDFLRLQELGFVAGARVQLLRKGLFGSPLLFKVGDSKIAIRQEEANWFLAE